MGSMEGEAVSTDTVCRPVAVRVRARVRARVRVRVRARVRARARVSDCNCAYCIR